MLAGRYRPISDQVAGRTDQAAGEVKETMGRATGDKTLEREGLAEQVTGKAQERDGDSPYCSTKAG